MYQSIYVQKFLKIWTLIGINWNKCYTSSIATHLISFHHHFVYKNIAIPFFEINSKFIQSDQNVWRMTPLVINSNLNILSIRYYLHGGHWNSFAIILFNLSHINIFFILFCIYRIEIITFAWAKALTRDFHRWIVYAIVVV